MFMLNAEAPKQVQLEIHSGLFWLEIAFRLTLKRCCLFFMLQSINDRIIVARKCDELIDFQVQSISSGLEAKRRKKSIGWRESIANIGFQACCQLSLSFYIEPVTSERLKLKSFFANG